eukprot:scaffold45752_cov35-Tisochrysis_lutea.AAC.2
MSSPSLYSLTSLPTRMLHDPSGTTSGRCAVSLVLVEPQWGSKCAPGCKAEKVDSPIPWRAISAAAEIESKTAEVTGQRLRLRVTCKAVNRPG